MAELAGSVALVTGAAAGIGRACAIALADAGADVAVLDVDAAGLAGTAEAVHDRGRAAQALVANVTDLAAVQSAVDAVTARWGRLDVAVNNAGVAGPYLPVDRYPEDEFLRVLQVDLVGVWRCLRAELAVMRRQGSGCVVNVSSMLGSAAMADNGAYVAAKHGVIGLTRTAALEMGPVGVRVNAVAPGVTRSGMTSAVSDELLRAVPLGRIAEPAEIAAAVTWLCSPASAYVTGTVLTADGGWLAGR